MLLVDSEVQIRKMKEEEKGEVLAAMRRSFSLLNRLFFSLSPNVLVGERQGEILGGIVLKVFKLPQNRKGGLIAWIFTTPEARGLGLGQRLTEAGIDFFEQQGCQEIFASVEGNNTSSSKLFATRDFGIISPGEQFRRYGLKTLALWFNTAHYFDVGHFLWVKPTPAGKETPFWQFWGTIIVTALIWLLMTWRNPLGWLTVTGATIILFGIRYLGMQVAARWQGLPVRYRAWESGFPLSAVIAVVFNGIFLVPGSLYPVGNDWRYKDLFPQLPRIALAGILPVLLITILAGISLHFNLLTPGISSWVKGIFKVGHLLLIYDTCLPFFPFNCFNGRKVWEWNKPLWIILTLLILSLFFLY